MAQKPHKQVFLRDFSHCCINYIPVVTKKRYIQYFWTVSLVWDWVDVSICIWLLVWSPRLVDRFKFRNKCWGNNTLSNGVIWVCLIKSAILRLISNMAVPVQTLHKSFSTILTYFIIGFFILSQLLLGKIFHITNNVTFESGVRRASRCYTIAFLLFSYHYDIYVFQLYD